MFGLAYAPPAHAAESYETPARLPVIAVVSSNARDYAVSLIDTPLLDATPTYHLRLTPLRKPKDNRLRELWIGAADYLPRKAVVAGNFTLAPLVDVPWTIDFSVVDGAPFVARETADATLFLAHRRVVRDARISFDDIHEADGSYIVNKPLLEPDPPKQRSSNPARKAVPRLRAYGAPLGTTTAARSLCLAEARDARSEALGMTTARAELVFERSPKGCAVEALGMPVGVRGHAKKSRL